MGALGVDVSLKLALESFRKFFRNLVDFQIDFSRFLEVIWRPTWLPNLLQIEKKSVLEAFWEIILKKVAKTMKKRASRR